MNLEQYKIPMTPVEESKFGDGVLFAGKLLGKAAIKGVEGIAKGLAIYLGLGLAAVSAILLTNHINNKQALNRLNSLSDAEKTSLNNYKTWVDPLNAQLDSMRKDLEKLAKKYNASGMFEIPDKHFTQELYSVDKLNPAASIQWSGQKPVFWFNENYLYVDENDEPVGDYPNQDRARKLQEALKEIGLKDLITRWKSQMSKFNPYFELVVANEDELELFDSASPDDEMYPYIQIMIQMKWVDKMGIIKPGLPTYK